MMLIYPTIFTTKAVGIGVDLYGTIWFYDWVRHSFESGELSGFTDRFFYPDGKDIFAHTGSNIVDAILSIPFQWFLGERYFGFLIAFLMVLNVAALRRVLSEFNVSRFGTFVTSIVWVLNPYVLSELNMGRPTQILLFPSFMALAHWCRILKSTEGLLKNKILLGFFVALQGWCYWFYGMFLVFFLLGYSLVDSKGSLPQLRKMLRQVWIPVVVCFILIVPAVMGMVESVKQGDVPGVMNGTTLSIQGMSEQIVPWMRGYHLHDPLGHPLIRTLLFTSMSLLILVSKTISKSLLGASICLWLVAIGPWVPIGETQYLNWFYLSLMKWIPFFERLWFPYRAMSYVFIGFSMCFALSINILMKEAHTYKRFGLVMGLIGAGLWDLHYVRSFPLTHTDTQASSIVDCIDGPYIELPIGFAHPSMMWQGDIGEPTFGGMGENGLTFLPKGYLNRLQNPFIEALKSKSLIVNSTKEFSPFDKERIVSQGFAYVLWDRSITEQERMKRRDDQKRPNEVFEIQRNLVELLGQPICQDAQYLVFSLLDVSLDSQLDVGSKWTWELPLQSSYEERLRQLGRVPD